MRQSTCAGARTGIPRAGGYVRALVVPQHAEAGGTDMSLPNPPVDFVGAVASPGCGFRFNNSENN
jgi:hypothetical protein